MCHARQAKCRTSAVTDLVGSVLLIGMTVAAISIVNVMILSAPAPANPVHVELSTASDPGPDLMWGTGDERILIHHVLGEPLSQNLTNVNINHNGAVTTISGQALGFTGGKLNIGETWSHIRPIFQDDRITISLVVQSGAQARVISESTAISGTATCSSDTVGPAAIMSQQPANIGAITGYDEVTIEVRAVDVCSGVDDSIPPSMVYTLAPGSPGEMIKIADDTWEVTLSPPLLGWASVVGQTFEWQVLGLADAAGNTANGTPQKDYIDPLPPAVTYVNGATPIIGTVDAFSAMQSSTDGNAVSTITEGLDGGGTGTLRLSANTIIIEPDPWSHLDDLDASDDSYAKYGESQEEAFLVGVADSVMTTGAVSAVRVSFEGHVDEAITDDGWRIAACLASICSQQSGFLSAGFADTTHTYDVTTLRPGGGAWKWADIDNLEIRIVPAIGNTLPGPEGKWHVDHVYADVDYGPGYDLDVHFNWTNVPSGLGHELQLRYSVAGEAFGVSVWDAGASQWNLRPQQLTAAGLAVFTTSLTGNEYNGGQPLVRIGSARDSPQDQGTLSIEYARVTTT